jgi:hypothetical protein
VASRAVQSTAPPSAAPCLDDAVGMTVGIRFPRGSVWRKWDLHVHTPGTKLSDGYTRRDGALDWDRFCQAVEGSDVAVVGITDYFSLSSFFTFAAAFRERYPDSPKVFFPNLELRLNETVNRVNEEVHLHLIFPPTLDEETAERFRRALLTEIRVENGRALPCYELTPADYERATVTRESIKPRSTE